MMTNYTTCSLAEVEAELATIARDAQTVFGHLNEQQLNWKTDPASWSVAQCFDHVLTTNRGMFDSIDRAMSGSRAPTMWQKLPVVPRIFGKMLIRSQMPEAKRKFKAPPIATPSSSAIDGRIIERFIARQADAAARLGSLDEREAARIIMVSPFVSFITYSVLDGLRLVVTHERRHFEQARRVTQQSGFPSSTSPENRHAHTAHLAG